MISRKQVISLVNTFEDDKKNKDKDSYYDNLKDLHYKDSWLHNTVELAALGAIMVGAGRMATNGDLAEVGNGLKQTTIKVMGKGAEKTLKKSGLTGAKFGWQVFKRAFGNLSHMQPQEFGKDIIVPGSLEYNGIVQNLEASDKDKKQIAAEVAKRIAEEDNQNYAMNKLYGNKYYQTSDNRFREVYEQVKHEELQKQLGYAPSGSGPKKKGKWFGNTPGDTNPMINPKNIGRDMVANGLAGIAFGAGISGIHSLDRWSSEKDKQKDLENTFSLAGSFLPKSENDNNNRNRDNNRNNKRNWDNNRNNNRNGYRNHNDRMNKQAELNPKLKEGLKTVGMKFPEALMAGMGYTAVSYGANKAFGHDPRQGGAIPPSAQNLDQNSNDKKSPHVIIELRQQGQHGPTRKKQEATLKVASMGGLAGLALEKGFGLNG